MSSKIIVAGGGHGGIAAGAMLARRGFDVTVVERRKRREMGYDWTDTFDRKALKEAELPMPEPSKYTFKGNMTFYGPSERTPLHQHIPEEAFELQMERRDIYNLLISNALKAGVKFVYGHNILGPIMAGDRVVGIKTEKGNYYGDLIIDAAGCESPVRTNLPDCCGIQKHPGAYEKFYAYRAFYNRGTDEEPKDKYRVYLSKGCVPSFAWVGTEDDHTDLLIGRFNPFGMDEVEKTAEEYRKTYPQLGDTVVRGGEFAEIPVRQTLAILVADGYAAIGDSAFMTIPMIGSGIANSLKAAKILTEAIVEDSSRTYSAETLWKYQRDYFEKIGNDLAPMAQVKLMFTKLSADDVDYLLDNEILTWRELSLTSESTSIGSMISSSSDLPHRAMMILNNGGLLKLLVNMVGKIARTMAVSSAMPKHYSRKSVQRWAEKYNECFERKG